MYAVSITGDTAIISMDENGRYQTVVLAIKAAIRAAMDVEITAISFGERAYSIIDEFTGGLKNDSVIIKEITGEVVKDTPLWRRFFAFAFSKVQGAYYDWRFSNNNSTGAEGPTSKRRGIWCPSNRNADWYYYSKSRRR
ncbi:hypothetical protein [Pseudaeromonas paramecii]|uniref:Uncharacterized protein n=1 Tax=Pseudaeromonas paramecii TaxID=2138166 RepID=A0ABP8PYY7_9GAMM